MIRFEPPIAGDITGEPVLVFALTETQAICVDSAGFFMRIEMGVVQTGFRHDGKSWSVPAMDWALEDEDAAEETDIGIEEIP